MKKLKFILVFALFAISAQAQDNVSPEKVALIKELLRLTGSEENTHKIFDSMVELQKAESERTLKSMIEDDKSMSAADKAEAKKMFVETFDRMMAKLERFFAEIKVVGLIEEASVRLYSKHFTEADLRELVAFYRSPVGKKVVETTPEFMLESMKVVSDTIVPKLDVFIKKITEEEFASVKQNLPAPKKKTVRRKT